VFLNLEYSAFFQGVHRMAALIATISTINAAAAATHCQTVNASL